MTQYVGLRDDDSIAKGDNRIIGLSSRELVAAEAYYHDHGYRDYTRPDKASKNSNCKSVFDWDEASNSNIESQAEFIRSDLLENPRLIKMVDVR